MSFFVNLPLSWVEQDPTFLDKLIKRSLQPEFGIDPRIIFNQSHSWHKRNLEKLENAGLSCSVHLPFYDMHPGSENPHILDGTRITLKLAAKVAKIYKAHHMVAHPIFNANQHSEGADPKTPAAGWLKRSVDTWSAVIEEAGGVPLCLENTFEKTPEPIVALVEKLGEKAGICLDIGHWFCYANGQYKKDLPRWIDCIAPQLKLLHLHDNNGDLDSHLGLGQGKILLFELFNALKAKAVQPTVTLEPHSEQCLEDSLAFIASHSDCYELQSLL